MSVLLCLYLLIKVVSWSGALLGISSFVASAGALTEAGTGAVINASTAAMGVITSGLSAGADVTIPEKDGYTPMHGAGFQGRAEIAKVLIKHGLDPSDMHCASRQPASRVPDVLIPSSNSCRYP